MKKHVFVVLMLVLLAAGPLALSGQPVEQFGEALGYNLQISYVTSYTLILTLNDAYTNGLAKEEALERCNFALDLVNGSLHTYTGIVSSYAQAAMITQKDLKGARDTVASYKALIEAGEALRTFIQSNGQDAESIGKFWNIMGAIYMALK